MFKSMSPDHIKIMDKLTNKKNIDFNVVYFIL